MILEKKSLRKAYGETLIELGKENNNIVVMDSDLSCSTQTAMFAKEFPNRFFNSGIAEQDMVATAAGLASQGFIPFISTFAMFATGRTYDQIRNSVCYPKFNVKIVATHGGVTVGEDGASHQALEDIALMRNLPNMTVIVPADYKEVQEAVKYAANNAGAMYIRIPRTNLPDIFDDNYKFDLVPKVLKEGTDVTIITNGETLIESITASEELLKEGIKVQVIHCPVVKPVAPQLLNLITSKTVYTIENHSIIGGLGSMVAELIAENASKIMLTRLGVNDEFGQSGTANELLDFYGLSAKKIVDYIKKKTSCLRVPKFTKVNTEEIKNELQIELIYYSGNELDNKLKEILDKCKQQNLEIKPRDMSGHHMNFSGPEIYLFIKGAIVGGIIYDTLKWSIIKLWQLYKGKRLTKITPNKVEEVEITFGVHYNNLKGQIVTAIFPNANEIIENEEKMLNSMFNYFSNNIDDSCKYIKYKQFSGTWIDIDITQNTKKTN